MPHIRVKTGKQKGKIFPIQGTTRLLIGRDATVALQINDQGVSREHAEIYRVGEMVFIRDLQSRNGSFVNDERITEELLRDGDVVRVGNTQLIFESSRSARGQDVEFEESETPFKTSLDLKIDDLYVTDTTNREGEMFKAMCQAAEIVQSERDEKVIFERLLDLIQDQIPADYLYLFLREETSGAVTPRAMRQKGDRKAIPISRSILRRVITESRAILTADAMQDDRFKADDSIVVNQIRAVLCVPVRGRGQVLGALYSVNSNLSDTFDQGDLQLISALCSQLATAIENLGTIRNRRRMFICTIGRLISLLENAPPGMRGHSERVAAYAASIAVEMGLPDPNILSLTVAGVLHDVGSLRTLTALLTNGNSEPTALDNCNLLLKEIPGLDEAKASIRTCGEWLDGSGPQRMHGESIPIGGRILAVANGFDELMYPTGKSTRDGEADPALVKKAFAELDQQAGKRYDPNVVRALFVAYRHGALRSATFSDSNLPAVRQVPANAAKPGDEGSDDDQPQTSETIRAERA